WPSTAKPATRTYSYDDLYRLIGITYSHETGGATDTWKSPYDAENTDATRQPRPSPQVSFVNRATSQGVSYDRMGNYVQPTDDQSGFWDRSLGNVTVGTPTSGPNQILSASNRTLSPSSTKKSDLSVAYDPASNLLRLIVRRDGSCLPSSASCWQRFDYDWDEI